MFVCTTGNTVSAAATLKPSTNIPTEPHKCLANGQTSYTVVRFGESINAVISKQLSNMHGKSAWLLIHWMHHTELGCTIQQQ